MLFTALIGTVAQIACGNSHGLILANEGLVFSFGSN